MCGGEEGELVGVIAVAFRLGVAGVARDYDSRAVRCVAAGLGDAARELRGVAEEGC